jgi:hypothetical protein
MATFRGGTHVNADFAKQQGKYKRIRISAGPHRGKYVDQLILEAKLGRPLGPGMTVEHSDGNTFNFGVAGSNLLEVPRGENTALMWTRRRRTTQAQAQSDAIA